MLSIERCNEILNKKSGQRLSPVDCLDVMNIIGRIVVAGNVRRSAQIAIGDCDDVEYLQAKRWDLGGIPNWRAMSNNSVVCDDISKLPAEFWEGYNGNGEPYGLINLEASRRMGRTFEVQYPDPDVQGFNPCAEQSLANFETCCLAEIYLPNIEHYEELKKVARYLYRINKHSLAIKCAVKETEDIVHKNMRMGIGVTGYLQATEEQRSWLADCYNYIRSYDKEYSELAGYPASIKLTTVKPSGTLSLLAGVTPGAHPGYSEYYIRRIRMSADSSLAHAAREHGYPVEFVLNFDGTEDKSTIVVSFPCKFPKGTMFAWAKIPDAYKEMGSIEFSSWLVKEAKVATSPGVGFGPGGEGYVRFALIENEQRTNQMMQDQARMQQGQRSSVAVVTDNSKSSISNSSSVKSVSTFAGNPDLAIRMATQTN